MDLDTIIICACSCRFRPNPHTNTNNHSNDSKCMNTLVASAIAKVPKSKKKSEERPRTAPTWTQSWNILTLKTRDGIRIQLITRTWPQGLAKSSHDLKTSNFGGFWGITLLIPNQLKWVNTFLLSIIKILLSSIFKFGLTAQIWPETTLFYHTLNFAHKVVRDTSGISALVIPKVTHLWSLISA